MHPSSIHSFIRRGILAAAGVILAAGLFAQEALDAKSLSRWTATGAAPAVDKAGVVTLPAGAQLGRVFPAGRVEVHLVTRPYFSTLPAGWCALEVGPADLTFVRNANGGGMVLLADELLDLPFALPLSDDGLSREPLDFVLRFNPETGKATLAIGGADFDVKATAPAGPVEVALSAGRDRAWHVTVLEVTTPKGKSAGPGGGSSGSSASAEVTEKIPEVAALVGDRADLRKQAHGQAKGLFLDGNDAAGEKALTDANRNPRNSAEWHLESANELIQAAFSLTRAGKPQKAAQVARRAVEHTEKASRKAARQANDALAATAESTAAFIQERLLADHAGAKSFYQSAALRQPNGQAIRELKRLDRAEKEGRRKSGENIAEDQTPDEIIVPPSQAQGSEQAQASESPVP